MSFDDDAEDGGMVSLRGSELLDFTGEVFVAGQHFTEFGKGADNQDAHLHGASAAWGAVFLETAAKCDQFNASASMLVRRNMKSPGKRPRLRFPCSLRRCVEHDPPAMDEVDTALDKGAATRRSSV